MDHYISRIRRLLKHTSSQYEYQQLRGDRSFRVLELLPAEKLGAQLICCIKEVDLDGYENKYEALSYVWGIPTPVQKLRSDCGQTFQITPNCASALRHLRLKSEIRTLWLDSICINQSSNDEKAHQIAMMSDIYKNAREVLVWLGEGDSSNAFIFKEYKLVAELIQAGSLRNPLETEGPPASRDEMLHDLPGRLGELLRPLNPTMVSQPSDLTLKRSLHSHLHIFGRAPGDPTTTARTSTSNLFLKNIEFLDKMEMTLRGECGHGYLCDRLLIACHRMLHPACTQRILPESLDGTRDCIREKYSSSCRRRDNSMDNVYSCSPVFLPSRSHFYRSGGPSRIIIGGLADPVQWT